MCSFRHFKILKGIAQISERYTLLSKLYEWSRITGCHIWSLLSSSHVLPAECNQNEKKLWMQKKCESFPFSFWVNYSKICEAIRKLFFTYSRWKYINHTWKISTPTNFIETNSINKENISWSIENQKAEALRSV